MTTVVWLDLTGKGGAAAGVGGATGSWCGKGGAAAGVGVATGGCYWAAADLGEAAQPGPEPGMGRTTGSCRGRRIWGLVAGRPGPEAERRRESLQLGRRIWGRRPDRGGMRRCSATGRSRGLLRMRGRRPSSSSWDRAGYGSEGLGGAESGERSTSEERSWKTTTTQRPVESLTFSCVVECRSSAVAPTAGDAAATDLLRPPPTSTPPGSAEEHESDGGCSILLSRMLQVYPKIEGTLSAPLELYSTLQELLGAAFYNYSSKLPSEQGFIGAVGDALSNLVGPWLGQETTVRLFMRH